jgi:hypothetical protein
MYARRFLGCVFVLTLLAVAGAFAMYQWGGRVLIEQAVPKGHFEPAKADGEPDYDQVASWVAKPGVEDNPSDWRPANDGPVDPVAVDARVFYIHPTTYLERDRWNAPLFVGGDTEFRTHLFVQSQASAFNKDAKIWAPRYRQAAYGAFLLRSEDAQKALDLAYSDIAAAFDEFLRQVPKKSPIILAGHSQGALHLERLLRDKVAGTPVAKRIVAAYIVGWPISTTSDLPALGLPACASPDQTGCILSWMTFADPPNADFFHDWEKTNGLNGGDRRREDALCVNPISGTLNGSAQPQDNAGTLMPTADLRSATLLAGSVGAHCEKGLLVLDGVVPQLGSYVLPGNNYHVYDYALFWGSIRRDAERRLAAWSR